MPSDLRRRRAPAAAPPLPRIVRLAEWTAGRQGLARMLLAMLLGAVATLAMPPAPGWSAAVLWVAFPGLIWLLAGQRSPFRAFWTGWFFGFGHFFVGLYWVVWAMTVEIDRLWPMIPLAMAGLPALLGIFTGLVTAAYVLLRLRGALAQVLVFAALWGAGEWLRGHVLTGFPWNLIGYAWVDTPVLQTVAAIGIYGLGVLTVAVAALPAVLRRRPGLAGYGVVAAGLAGLAALYLSGTERLAAPSPGLVPGVTLRLVQPNIDQSEKWRDDLRLAHFSKQLEMSARPSDTPITAVIWAETAVPYLLSREPEAQRMIGAALPDGAVALVGAPRASDPAIPELMLWNSLYAIDGGGSVTAIYDKAHLVPFGEYVPFRTILPIDRVVPGHVDYTPGSGPRTLDVAGLPPVSPLICYEVIFPGQVVAPDGPRPGWLLNITNDGWYGMTAGPHQHFAIARTRAVEQGLPLVRVANTGISGVVDARGTVLATLGLGEEGVLDVGLPAALPTPTPYSVWGDRAFWLLVILNLGIGLTLGRLRL